MDQGSSFGALLRRLRVAAGLTQEALAERAGLSVRTVSDLERGVNRMPRKDTLPLLAEALALSAEETRRLQAAAQHPSGGTAVLPGGPAIPPLAGRTQELTRLEHYLAGAGPPVLVLAGEPGIGKTRLLQEARRQATQAGWHVLAGGCHRRGGQEPYAPLLGALHGYLARQTAVQQRANLRGCAWLVRLLPELAAGPIAPLPAGRLPPEQERRLMFAAVGQFLANVAGPAGTLLVLDDLQWAGPDALDLLAALVRSSRDVPLPLPLRVLGAYRDTELPPQDPLSVLLADLAHAGLAAHQALAPLTPVALGRLFDDLLQGIAVPAAVRDQVVTRTGGVPFYLISYARELRASVLHEAASAVVPWDVRQSMRQRVAALSPDAQEVIGVAAVAGREVPYSLLRAAVSQPEAEVLAGLEAACRAHLLEEASSTATYRFPHDVTREVIESGLGVARQMALHRRVAEALEQGPGEAAVEQLAYHYSHSEVQEKAIRYLERAGDRAQAQYAAAAAEGYYRAAEHRLEQLGRALETARVREKRAEALNTLGQPDAALVVLEQAAETYEAAGDVERMSHAVAQIGHTLTLQWMHEGRVRRLEPFLARLEERAAVHGVASLYVALAELYFWSGRVPESLAAADRAVALAGRAADRRMLATAQERRAQALMFLIGRLDEALQTAEEASRMAEEAGDLETCYYALQDVVITYRMRGQFAASDACAQRAVTVAERWGSPRTAGDMAGQQALTAYYRGEWDRVRREVARPRDQRYAPGLRASLALATGAWDEVSQVLADAAAAAEGADNLFGRRAIQAQLAERDLLVGQPAAARARLVPLLDRAGQQEADVSALLPLLAWAQLDLGELDEAERVVAQALARLRADGRLELVDALRVQALIALRQEQWATAEAALAEGVALARSMPYPYAEARLLAVEGEMHRQRGAHAAARARLDEALALYQRLGAHAASARTAQAIAAVVRTAVPAESGGSAP